MVNYGCCKNKSFPLNYYICQKCFKVFHRSCVQQSKAKFKFLKDFQIICCSSNLDYSDTDEKSLMEQTISDLTENNDMQNNYIEKLKLEHKHFVEEASQREDDFLEQIQKQRKCIDEYDAELIQLRETIKTLTSKSTDTVSTQTNTLLMTINNSTQTENVEKVTISLSTQTTNEANFEERAAEFEKTIRELNNILQNMLVSIDTLTQENKIYQYEIEELKSKISFLNGTGPNEKKTVASRTDVGRRRIVVVSHSRGRNLGMMLRNLLEDYYEVESIVKPHADDKELIQTALKNSGRLGRNDVVFLWPNKCKSSLVSDFLLPLKNTRGIIITEPYHSVSSTSNDVIYKTNLELLKAAYHAKLEDCVLESNNFLRKSNYRNPTNLNNKGKYFLCKAIKNVIINCKLTLQTYDKTIDCNNEKLITCVETEEVRCNSISSPNRMGLSPLTMVQDDRIMEKSCDSFLDLKKRAQVSI